MLRRTILSVELACCLVKAATGSLMEASGKATTCTADSRADVFGWPADVPPRCAELAKRSISESSMGEPFGIAQRLRISTKVARAAIDRYSSATAGFEAS